MHIRLGFSPVTTSEPIIDYLRRRLEEFRGQWPQIAKDTGVEYSIIARIARGENENPELKNIQPLLDWFVARDEMVEKLRKSA